MENKLEQLLNTLIQRGWKPRDEESVKSCMVGEPFYKRKFIEKDLGFYIDDRGTPQWLFTKSLREICSKGSGLWQFVCENGMYRKEYLGIYFNDERAKNVFYKIDQWDEEGDVIQTGDMEGDEFIHMSEPEYRIIETALTDEDKLEQFLLDNIHIDE